MRVGAYRIGSFRCAEPETETAITQSTYLALLKAYMADGYTRDEARDLIARPGVFTVPYAWDQRRDGASSDLYTALPGVGCACTVMRQSTEPKGSYQLYLRGIGHLPWWFDADWKQAVNRTHTLTFTYPSDADHAGDLKRPNIVDLFDGDGYLLQSFYIRGALPHISRTALRP